MARPWRHVGRSPPLSLVRRDNRPGGGFAVDFGEPAALECGCPARIAQQHNELRRDQREQTSTYGGALTGTGTCADLVVKFDGISVQLRVRAGAGDPWSLRRLLHARR